MKYSELQDYITKLQISLDAAKKADLIDNNANINDFEVMFANEAGGEFEIDDIQLDIMGEPYRIMFVNTTES